MQFVWRPDAELVEEQPAEAVVVVLAGVDQDVLGVTRSSSGNDRG